MGHVKRGCIFVEERKIFVKEKTIFVKERNFFLKQRTIFIKERTIFVEENHFCQGKDLFIKERTIIVKERTDLFRIWKGPFIVKERTSSPTDIHMMAASEWHLNGIPDSLGQVQDCIPCFASVPLRQSGDILKVTDYFTILHVFGCVAFSLEFM